MTLTDLERLMEGATEGPWCWGRTGTKDNSYAIGAGSNNKGEPYSGEVDTDEMYENFIYRGLIGESDGPNFVDPALIVALRNMAPVLVKVAKIAGERPTRFGAHYAMWLYKMDDALRELEGGKG